MPLRRRISGSGMASTLPAQYWWTWSPRCAGGGCTAAAPSDAHTSQVVAAAVRGTPQRGWAFDERAALTFESGSGNNWARGYNTYGPQFRSRACELLRREVRTRVCRTPFPRLLMRQGVIQAEACDQLGGFLVLQSVAGGTGAGLGAYLVEALRCVLFSARPGRIVECLTRPTQGRVPRCVRAQPVRVAVRVWRGHRAKLQHAADACHATRRRGRRHHRTKRGASYSSAQVAQRRKARTHCRSSCQRIADTARATMPDPH